MDSDIQRVVQNARRYFGMDVPIYISTRPKKKFMNDPMANGCILYGLERFSLRPIRELAYHTTP